SRELTVIVGSRDATSTLRECIAALVATCAGIDAEILLVEATDPDTAKRSADGIPSVRVIAMSEGSLVPALWGRGLREARGRVVAFTIGQCVVSQGWAGALLAGLRAGAVGVGGPLELRRGSSATARATFYLRYSAWLSMPSGQALEIAGDNAAYDHAALREVRSEADESFWEVEAHARLRALGRTLEVSPHAVAWFTDSTGLAEMAARRFAHGRHSGAFRVRNGVRPRWQVVVGAPLVPLVLLARVARRVARAPGHASGFLSSLGAFLVLASAWAAGEAVGGFTSASTARGALRAA
ncbi:MAG TPA: glycosyltransferase, partial [Gemmatimonadaceae bacterium]|nr:glycosyltransferase [Gemmatimonadaceae bacterium]